MEKLDDELIAELKEGGIIENLEAKIRSFLRSIDYINEELSDNGNGNYLEIEQEIDTIKQLLMDIQITQRLADELFENMTTEQRNALRASIPKALIIFGWYDRLTEDGEIRNRH